MAATIQEVLVQTLVNFTLQHGAPHLPEVEGLAFAGGVAYNAKLNTDLQRRLRKPLHVPPAPGDYGVIIGAAWASSRPLPKSQSPLHSSVSIPIRWNTTSRAQAPTSTRSVE